jgi:hypothetical protein
MVVSGNVPLRSNLVIVLDEWVDQNATTQTANGQKFFGTQDFAVPIRLRHTEATVRACLAVRAWVGADTLFPMGVILSKVKESSLSKVEGI